MTDAVSHWYVVHCRPFREKQAAIAIQETLGLTVYLPKFQQCIHGQPQWALLFPRYLFVRANLRETTPGRINAIPGVIRMVGFDTGPQPIPPAVIEALHEVQRRAQHRGVPRQSVGCPDRTEHPKQESLRGFAGVFQGNGGADERVQVFIEFLGRLKKAQPAADAADTTGEIEIGAAPAPRRPRRTRGKGRKINYQQPQQGQLLRNCDGNETVG